MSEEQLSAFLAAVKDDTELQKKLKGAGDLETAVAIAMEAGFAVSKADWLRFQAKQILELSDADLDAAAGGTVGWVIGTPLSCINRTADYCD